MVKETSSEGDSSSLCKTLGWSTVRDVGNQVWNRGLRHLQVGRVLQAYPACSSCSESAGFVKGGEVYG